MKALPFAMAILLTAAACTDTSGGGDGDPADLGADAADGRVLPGTDGAPPDALPPDAHPDPDDGIPLLDAEVRRPDQGGPDEDGGTPALPELCLAPPMRPEQPPIDLAAHCRGRGEPLAIRDLRDDRCPDALDFRDGNNDGFSDMRYDVAIADAVVSGRFPRGFSVQDPDGGAFSGLWVFTDRDPVPEAVVPGAHVSLRGRIFEFYTLAEMTLDADGLTVLRQGAPPAPLLVSDPARLADGGDLIEAFESLLVEVQNVVVTLTEPDCPNDFGMFVLDGRLRVEDEVELGYEPSRGDFVSRVVGVVHFSFDHMKIRPRDLGDLQWTYCGGVPDKCEASDCPVEPGAPETRELIVTEIQDDPRGSDAMREWLELYNPGPEDFDLDGWWVQTCAGRRGDLSGRLRAGDRLVMAGSLDETEAGGVQADLLLGGMQLSNAEGSVLVFNAGGDLVDQVRYLAEAPWPARGDGQSLELIAPAADNSNGATWRAGRRDYGPGGQGTPGR
ncbi:MAG: lamin tail domain-containing protein [Myxococcales bacterium]|nr:lamin tail domain-containing protein [Myxococcales bacterium]